MHDVAHVELEDEPALVVESEQQLVEAITGLFEQFTRRTCAKTEADQRTRLEAKAGG